MAHDFDGLSTELRLAIFELRDHLRKDIQVASNGVLTEMRSRMQRNEEERNVFYATTNDAIRHIEKIASETRADGKETKEFARKTNGRVNRHDEILLGEDGGEEGLINKVAKNTKWMAGLIAAGGAWLGFLGLLWMVWGGEVQARGILNRPASDYVDFVDARIKQWIPGVDKPNQPAPNLTPKKNGVETPNN